MSHNTNHDVGKAFAAVKAMKGGGGNWRTVLTSEGICIGVSYSTPVCATDGATVLRTIHTYSVTTTAKHLGTIHRAQGEFLPATEGILTSLAYGTMTFAHAVKLGRDLLKFASIRLHAQGVPIERFDGGYRPTWAYRAEDAYVFRVGGKWQLRVDGINTSHRTLREARVAMWDAIGLIAIARWQDVTHEDVLAAGGLRGVTA